MAPVDRRILSRTLIAGLVVAAVGLAGCGRKAALDAPPGAAATAVDPAAAPDAPKKPNKPFFLDWLL